MSRTRNKGKQQGHAIADNYSRPTDGNRQNRTATFSLSRRSARRYRQPSANTSRRVTSRSLGGQCKKRTWPCSSSTGVSRTDVVHDVLSRPSYISIVCHTLPYTCNYVREDAGPANTHTLARGTEVQEHEEIPALHSVTVTQEARLPSEEKHEPLSPFSAVYGEQTKQPLSPGSSDRARWVLKPRRVHAALNSGVKSLSENSKIVLVSWPGDIRGVDGEKVGAGSLTHEQRTKLEEGFEDVARKEKGEGIRCVPVWMDDKVRAYSNHRQFVSDILTLASDRSLPASTTTTAKASCGRRSTTLGYRITKTRL